jgi:hypothetical protein
MIHEILRRSLAALILLVSCVAYAQETTTTTATTETTTSTEAPRNATTVILSTDSRETRQEFQELLRRLPPDVGKVLKLDPSLWSNKEYLATYPALAAFVNEHPDVSHSPAFYLESVWIPGDFTPETASTRIWSNMLETISIFCAFVFFAGVLTWLIRTGIEHRRWSRLAKTQAEVHNKLMDRFASNEDLLNYIQTPVGKRFLESAPILLDPPAARPVSAPIGRILLSVQAGLVLLAGGIGMQFVSMTAQKDAAEPLAALGTLGIAVGVGLVVSAAASFLLSRRLGLWREPVSADTNASE